jgi:excisionase family DNA binding protein
MEVISLKLISCYELMKMLGVSRSTLDRWRHKGMPSHQPVGRKGAIRFDEAEVNDWLKNKENSPTNQSK